MPMWAKAFRAASVAFLLAGPTAAQDADPARIVAEVNGTGITLGHMIALRGTLPQEYLQLPDEVLFNGILEQLIQQVALAAVGEKEISLKSRLELENQRRAYLSGTVLDRTAEAAVTDEALQAMFAETYANAAPEKEYSAGHVLVETEDEARAILTRLQEGADFAEIAAASSTDRGSATAGGDLGWFGLGMMVEPFETAVIAMDPGQLSAPVQTQFGWHIIRLNGTRQASGPTFEEKRDELAAELQQKAVEAKVTELTAAAKVTRSTDGIDPAVLKQSGLLDN